VAGTWTYQGAMVELQPLRELAPDERRAVEEEAHLLEGFLAGGSA
jgi:hypothetical protein